jgi:CMP/dCMP kinase
MSEKGVIQKRSPELGFLVVIGGPGGSGSSTISKMITEKYGLTRHYAGGMFREIAKEEGHVDFRKFLEEIEKKKGKDYDLEVDNRLLRVSQTPNIMIEAKAFAALAIIKNIPCTIKIWITADIDVRTRRVLSRDGILKYGDPVTDVLKKQYEEAKFDILSRQEILGKRLKFLYGIEYGKQELYNDLIVDSSKQSVEETFNLVWKEIEKMKEETNGNKAVPNGKMEDLEVNWRRWKCLVCGYMYEGTDTSMKCPKCGNEDISKFQDID